MSRRVTVEDLWVAQWHAITRVVLGEVDRLDDETIAALTAGEDDR